MKRNETETYSPSKNKVYVTRGVAQLMNLPTIRQGIEYGTAFLRAFIVSSLIRLGYSY